MVKEFRTILGSRVRPYFKGKSMNRAGDVVPVVECLCSIVYVRLIQWGRKKEKEDGPIRRNESFPLGLAPCS